jgi:hypothetical protein
MPIGSVGSGSMDPFSHLRPAHVAHRSCSSGSDQLPDRPVAGPAHLEQWHRASFWLGPPNFSTLTINKKVNNKFAGLPKSQNGSAISSPPVYVCLHDFLGLGLRCLAPDDRPSRTHVSHDPNSLYSPAERRRRLR